MDVDYELTDAYFEAVGRFNQIDKMEELTIFFS